MSRDLERSIGVRTAAGVVIANMIGAGIFTTTGFQAADLGNPVYIYLLWILGGVLALAGALCYAELGAAIPRAGGEYAYLHATYGGMLAFASALVSLTAGFSAPIASALKGLTHYLQHFIPVLGSQEPVLGALVAGDVFAICAVWLLVAIHIGSTGFGLGVTNIVTALKVLGILLLVGGALTIGNGDVESMVRASQTSDPKTGADLFGALATSLIFVMFCYSGWNAASYLAGEMRAPERDLPRALLVGTASVMVAYLALNLVYFYGASVDELAGKVEVGLVASENLFGSIGAGFVVLVLAVSLLASASAMTVVGPRVYYALGQDFAPLGFLARVNPTTGTPIVALTLQAAVTSIVILLGRVDQIQQYAGFTLSLMATLAVSCVIVLRLREPDLPRPFRVWGYPFTPLLFIGVSVWMMVWAFRGRPTESLLGLLTVATGCVIYRLAFRSYQRRHPNQPGD
ncbi:MAG: amino acid permease [Deltaproteobacteria bacterium]|nr:amino acid permease [Deltaproteobacteria bacterium]MBW2417978.1 amino acid permease [Deltaproteobacteria bacterium]